MKLDAYSKDSMAEEMKRHLQQLLSKVDGLLAILITDRDGVPVLKAKEIVFLDRERVIGIISGKIRDLLQKVGPTNSTLATENAPELAMRPGFLSTFGMATEQGSKLGLGKNKSVICMYSTYQVVQMNKLPLMISFIATNSCNTGHLLSLEQSIEPLLSDLKCAVAE